MDPDQLRDAAMKLEEVIEVLELCGFSQNAHVLEEIMGEMLDQADEAEEDPSILEEVA